MRQAFTTLVAVVLTLVSLANCRGDKDGEEETMIRVTGIPDENPTKLAREYEPLVRRLEEALSAKVRYVPVNDYGAAVQALAAGKVDFAWLGGFTHVQARTLTKVEPVAMREIDRAFHSVFIARVDGPIQKMEDIAKGTLAFGSKSSTSGHLMPRYFLKKNFAVDVTADLSQSPLYSGAHDATVKLVAAGKVDVGAVNAQVWERMVADGEVDTSQVHVLWTTPAYSDYVWTARSDVPAATREAFATFFLGLDHKSEADRGLLELLGASRYVAASPSDFDAVEAVARSSGLLK